MLLEVGNAIKSDVQTFVSEFRRATEGNLRFTASNQVRPGRTRTQVQRVPVFVFHAGSQPQQTLANQGVMSHAFENTHD